jgi:hypothetical protein
MIDDIETPAAKAEKRADLNDAVSRFLETGGTVQEVEILKNRPDLPVPLSRRYDKGRKKQQEVSKSITRSRLTPEYLKTLCAVRNKTIQ